MISLLTAKAWRDYELVDSGEGEKLERWSGYLTVRPEPRAIWDKANPGLWKAADAVFLREEDERIWKFRQPPPDPWIVAYRNVRFGLKPAGFKHVGVFPEQTVNWDWIRERIGNRIPAPGRSPDIKILNLFAYTGGATLAAALAGAKVTHVDGSRPAMKRAAENAILTGVASDRIRWIPDDAGKFVRREIRRGEKYDGIIMDPPKFGRGARDEVWKLLEDLPELARNCRQLLTARPVLFLINAYAADISSLALHNLLTQITDGLAGTVEAGELSLTETAGGRLMPAGVFARWQAEAEEKPGWE